VQQTLVEHDEARWVVDALLIVEDLDVAVFADA
jgi:hypothetical protein